MVTSSHIPTDATRTAHIILAPKGGIGKSFAAFFLLQLFQKRGYPTFAADTDPLNQTLQKITALKATFFNISPTNHLIDPSVFDGMIESILETNGISVIDVGSSSYLPMMQYLIENRVPAVLREHGCQLFIHSLLVGNECRDDTILALHDVLTQLDCPSVVWLNEHFGPVVRDGRGFFESAIYHDHKDRIRGVITLPQRTPHTYGKDVRQMLERHQTFAEAITVTPLMTRQRLTTLFDETLAQFNEIDFSHA